MALLIKLTQNDSEGACLAAAPFFFIEATGDLLQNKGANFEQKLALLRFLKVVAFKVISILLKKTVHGIKSIFEIVL
ncbi:MAG: hypothetical protein K0Q73_8162 [Paenibacillus sp.]|jgi:hypothetical protein|nr:hypothetical protein [Paenibacillus sp.]